MKILVRRFLNSDFGLFAAIMLLSLTLFLGLTTQAKADAPAGTYYIAQNETPILDPATGVVEDPPPIIDEEPATPTATPVVVPIAPNDTSVFMGFTYADLKEGVNWILTALGGVVLYWLRNWFKIDKDSKMNEALHTALARGVSIAQQVINPQIDKLPQYIDVNNKIVAMAAQYALDNRGEAVKYFGLTKEKLQELAVTHLGPTLPVMTATVGETAK